jgi:hypothetical protein
MAVDARVRRAALNCWICINNRLATFHLWFLTLDLQFPIFRPQAMSCQRLGHRIPQSGQRQPTIGRQPVATAISAINDFAWAEEESRPRQIEIKIKHLEIDAAHVGEPDENKLVGQVRDRRLETSHLPVEGVAIGSVGATEDDQKRFAGLASSLKRFLIAGQPDWRLGIDCFIGADLA